MLITFVFALGCAGVTLRLFSLEIVEKCIALEFLGKVFLNCYQIPLYTTFFTNLDLFEAQPRGNWNVTIKYTQKELKMTIEMTFYSKQVTDG